MDVTHSFNRSTVFEMVLNKSHSCCDLWLLKAWMTASMRSNNMEYFFHNQKPEFCLHPTPNGHYDFCRKTWQWQLFNFPGFEYERKFFAIVLFNFGKVFSFQKNYLHRVFPSYARLRYSDISTQSNVFFGGQMPDMQKKAFYINKGHHACVTLMWRVHRNGTSV